MARVPSPRLISHKKKPASFAQTKWRIVFATSPKYDARNRTRLRISPRNANCLFSFKFKETTFFLLTFFFQLIIRRLPFEQHTKKGVFGTVRTEAYHRYIPPVLPVPDTSVSSVHQYRYRALRYLRYHINTATGYFGNVGTTSIPVPDTSVTSVHQYRYRTLW